MANIRVKDLPNTNAANDNDEFIVDSSTSGTRRISYSELKSEISTDFAADVATYGIATLDSDNKLTASQIPDSLAQGMNFVGVANSSSDLTSTTQGDFYVIQTAFGVYSVGDQAVYDGSAYVRVVDGTKEISEGGTGATTLDAAKTNLEIIDVGTGPSQVPLNQHLGTMAYQSSDGVSAAKIEVESTTGTATTQALTVTDGTDTNFVVQEDGKTGIGTASPNTLLECYDTVKPVIRLSGSGNNAGATNYGSIEFFNRDTSGDGPNVGAQIHVESASSSGGGGNLVFSTETVYAEGEGNAPVARMTIDHNGLVGIGVAAPGAVTDISGSSASGRGLRITETSASKSNGNYTLEVDSSAQGANVSAAGAMKIDVASGRAMTVDGLGRVGMQNDSPGSANGNANNLVIGNSTDSTSAGISIVTQPNRVGSLFFANGTSGVSGYVGRVQYDHSTNALSFGVNGMVPWSISSTGNLVANGTAIDFGSTNTTAGVTVTGSTLDHYEEGTWTPTTNGDATGVIGASDAVYTRIGNIVTVRATFTVTTNFTSNQIGGLPYLPATNTISNSTSGTPVMTLSATSSPIIAHVLGNSNTVRFTSGTNLGSNHALSTTHASYRVFLSYNV